MDAVPLKILQTCFSHSWGGLELQALEVSKQLQSRDHHLWLACCRGSRLQEEAMNERISTLPFEVSGYVHPVVIWQLSRIIKQKMIDIIHCQLSRDISTIVPAMKMSLKTIPILLSKRVGSYLQKNDLLHRLTYSHVSRVLAISTVIHRNVLETTPMPPDRVLTMHDAIDTELFSPARVDRRRARQEFGFSDDSIVIGFVGRFSPGKGHEEFLAAADMLRKKRENLHFLIVGEASFGEQQYEHRVKSMSHSLGLDNVVRFVGFRKDIPEVMASFDVFAFPSHAESFGIVLIEAMAMERPVVSTNCDGVLDIVVNGETGLYVRPRSPIELANALTRLVDDPSLREKLGKAGRKRVEQFFDQKKQIQKLEDLYYQLLGTLTPQAEMPSASA